MLERGRDERSISESSQRRLVAVGTVDRIRSCSVPGRVGLEVPYWMDAVARVQVALGTVDCAIVLAQVLDSCSSSGTVA